MIRQEAKVRMARMDFAKENEGFPGTLCYRLLLRHYSDNGMTRFGWFLSLKVYIISEIIPHNMRDRHHAQWFWETRSDKPNARRLPELVFQHLFFE